MVPRLRSGRLCAHGCAGVLGEYDGNNNLLRKYIYGPGVDQPISMIEVADSNATYYYHYDALGSVIALSDSSGDTVQTYEYSVFGEVAVEDANHTNPYMFAGRRFDIEIGLYYNRARYYNAFTGRFLQADPIGYGDGMNMYAYCGNNSLNFADPSGLIKDFRVTQRSYRGQPRDWLTWTTRTDEFGYKDVPVSWMAEPVAGVCEILFWRDVTTCITMTYISDSFGAFVYFIER